MSEYKWIPVIQDTDPGLARRATREDSLACAQAVRLNSYLDRVIPDGRASVATSLLAFWERPWSSNATRYAVHALRPAYARGIDVLEYNGHRYRPQDPRVRAR